MTGLEHYKRAEEMLATVAKAISESSDSSAMAALMAPNIAGAQVHATLALAAQVGELIDAYRANGGAS